MDISRLVFQGRGSRVGSSGGGWVQEARMDARPHPVAGRNGNRIPAPTGRRVQRPRLVARIEQSEFSTVPADPAKSEKRDQ